VLEGDDAATDAVTPTIRLSNVCQISDKVCRVSGTQGRMRCLRLPLAHRVISLQQLGRFLSEADSTQTAHSTELMRTRPYQPCPQAQWLRQSQRSAPSPAAAPVANAACSR
jgi:hypothetical protein